MDGLHLPYKLSSRIGVDVLSEALKTCTCMRPCQQVCLVQLLILRVILDLMQLSLIMLTGDRAHSDGEALQ